MGAGDHSIDPKCLSRLAEEIADIARQGLQIGIVIGGGNILRGADIATQGINRVTADHMGMLATIINALAMQDALTERHVPVQVMSAISMGQVCDNYNLRHALNNLEKGVVMLFAGGTGNPLFTTDSAASLRAIEIGADILIKATKVNGVYSADPLKHRDAHFYPRLSYNQALREDLKVMDATALVLCRDHGMSLRVLNIYENGAMTRMLHGEDIGSLVYV